MHDEGGGAGEFDPCGLAFLAALRRHAAWIELAGADTGLAMPLHALLALSLSLPSAGVATTAVAPATPASTAADTSVAADASWYVVAGGQRTGPFTNAQIAADYLAGRVTDATVVWRDGDADWKPLSQSPGFAELDRWYAGQDGRVQGPISGDAMRQLLDDGRVRRLDLSRLSVRLEWSSEWTPLAQAWPLDGTRATTPTRDAVGPAPVPPGYNGAGVPPERPDDAAKAAKIRKLRLGGAVLVGVGGGLIVLGGGLAGGYSSGAIGAGGLWAGVVMAGVGIGPAIAGFVMVGVANRRQRSLAARTTAVQSLRVGALAGGGQMGLSLRGRF